MTKATRETVPTQSNLEKGEEATSFLLKELETFKDLCIQAESDTLSIFNFYLTLMTGAIGGVVFLIQLNPPDPISTTRTQFIIGGFLIFVAGFGTASLFALSARYANCSRYAQGMDEIRRHLINQLHIPVPSTYEPFLLAKDDGPSRSSHRIPSRLMWISPSGAYQVFIASVTSACWAIAIWLLMEAIKMADSQARIVIALIVFLLTFATNNFLSRYVKYVQITRWNVSINEYRSGYAYIKSGRYDG